VFGWIDKKHETQLLALFWCSRRTMNLEASLRTLGIGDVVITGEPVSISFRSNTPCQDFAKFLDARVPGVSIANLSFGRMANAEISLLAPALSKPTTVTHLDLSWNQIGDEGFANLGHIIKGNSCITNLLVKNNRISNDGMVSFITAISSPGSVCAITNLDLSGNTISDRGIIALARFLSLPTCNLRSLDLSFNPIPATAVTELATHLKTNKTLRLLKISGECGGKLELLCDAIAESGSLIEADLWTIGVPSAKVEAMRKRLSKNDDEKCKAEASARREKAAQIEESRVSTDPSR
jgi:hypothetical protein